MGDSTQISWCDATWNGWWGCEKVSPACAHCYAERDSNRYGHRGLWGADHRFRWLSDANWQKPMLWAAHARNGLLPGGKTPIPEGAYGIARRPRVFAMSMADVFEERDELELPRLRFMRLIEKTPELDWLVLTKRPEFARDWLRNYNFRAFSSVGEGPSPPNLWLGVSIENAAFTWRVEVLLDIPVRVRFLSCEPLLGSLFPEIASRPGTTGGSSTGLNAKDDPAATTPDARAEREGARPVDTRGSGHARSRAPLDLGFNGVGAPGIDWVIVGGESGPRSKARPTHPAWVREIRDVVLGEGRENDPQPYGPWTRPALHFKQWGSYTPDPNGIDPDAVWVKLDGTRVSSFQADVYGIDLNHAVRMRYAGPRPGDGGKYLDGTDWCEFPATDIKVAA
jgi:protein gp37